jgi:formylglycine-generating enzyme required for sulfatase activity
MQIRQRTPLFVLLSFLSIQLNIQAQAEPVAAITNFDLKFATIPAGQFIMGTTDLNKALADLPDPKAAMINDETPAHKVVFEKPFRLSQTEVTQKTWLSIMGSRPGPDSHWQAKNWEQLPVVSVSWTAANNFIDKLNQQSPDVHYRLPTEAEWEYAARAGDTGLRPFSRLAMDEYAWYIHNSNDEVQAVAQLKANAWGLYDMHGNVWEWVADWYSPTAYEESAKINPQGPEQGSKKIRRGGSYHCPPHLIRSAYRAADIPTKAYSVLGFRLVAEKNNTGI